MNSQKNKTEALQTTNDASDQLAKSAARRRLLKIGATAGTTALATLASRPALACACVMPSAWGSILATGQTDLHALSGSISHHISKDFKSWTINSWQNNSSSYGGSNCRDTLATKLGKTRSIVDGYTVSTLRNKIGTSGYNIAGIANNDKWLTTINSNSFACSILVAELNLYTSSDIPTSECGSLKAMIRDMADGSFTPQSGDTTSWSQSKIKEYLHYNWLAHS